LFDLFCVTVKFQKGKNKISNGLSRTPTLSSIPQAAEAISSFPGCHLISLVFIIHAVTFNAGFLKRSKKTNNKRR
jgi:hypothetical protein